MFSLRTALAASSESTGWKPVRPHGQDGRATRSSCDHTAKMAVPREARAITPLNMYAVKPLAKYSILLEAGPERVVKAFEKRPVRDIVGRDVEFA